MKVQFVIESYHTGIHGGLRFNGTPTAYLMSNLIAGANSTAICDYYEDSLRYGIIHGKPGKKNYHNATTTVVCTPDEAVALVEEFLSSTKLYCPPIDLNTWIVADTQHQDWLDIVETGAFRKPEVLAKSKEFDVPLLRTAPIYFKETSEDFSTPNHIVKVSCAQTGENGEWRVGVWGASCYGLVKSFTDQIEALLCRAAVVELEDVTHDVLYSMGFEVYR